MAGVETLDQSPAFRMDARETPAVKATDPTAPWMVQRDMCTFTIPKSFLVQEEMVLAQICSCCLLLPKNKEFT